MRTATPACKTTAWWRTRAGRVAILAAFAVAMLGGLATDVGPWYRALQQPPWRAPDWLFGPVWTLLYGLCAAAAARGWLALQAQPRRQRVWLLVWVFNATLNVLWNVLFFSLRRPDWALAESVLLLASIVLLLVLAPRTDRRVQLLLWPYLLWVSFATVLNLAVVTLNAPFSGLQVVAN